MLDAFYHPATIEGRGRVPRSLRTLEATAALHPRQPGDNHARLAELHQRRDPDLMVLCAHDPSLYETARVAASSTRPPAFAWVPDHRSD